MKANNNMNNLWNVLEPGDPYDIRKSMIAKLPDHPSKPMAPFLQLISLLQAAEIQRLTDYLSQYKTKYRQIQRIKLDRHSYQIQIKQLAQKNASMLSFKAQNQRLKDFIRRQSQELEQLQKNQSNSIHLESLQLKYENSLNELKSLREQCEKLEHFIVQLESQGKEYKVRLQKSQYERNNMQGQYEQWSRSKISVEIKEARQKFEDRIEKLNLQIRDKSQLIQNKNQEIYYIIGQKEQYIREIRLLQEKNKNRQNVQDVLTQKNKEINKLHGVLQEKSMKLEQYVVNIQRMNGEMNIVEERYRTVERQRESLMGKVREYEARFNQQDRFEEKVAMMSMEIQRLNGINTIRNRELAEMTYQNDRIKLQLSSIQGQLKSKTQECMSLQQRFSINDINMSKMSTLATEKSRLEQQLQESRSEYRNFKIIKDGEINNLKLQLNKMVYNLQMVTKQKNNMSIECQTRLRELNIRREENQKLKMMVMSLERVEKEVGNSEKMIKEKQWIITQKQTRIKDIQMFLFQKEKDIQENNLHINRLTSTLDQLELNNRSLKTEAQELTNNNNELEASIQNIYKEVDRLHSILKTKVNELQTISKYNNQLQEVCRKLEQKIAEITESKEYLQNKLTKMGKELEETHYAIQTSQNGQVSKIHRLQSEKDNADKALGEKDHIIKQYIKQKDTLERKIIDYQRDLALHISIQEQLKRQITASKAQKQEDNRKLKLSLQETNAIIKNLQTKKKELQKECYELQFQWKQSQKRWLEGDNKYKQLQRHFLSKEQQKQYYKKEYERLNTQISRFNSDIQEINRERQKYIQQNKQLRKKIDGLSKEDHHKNINIEDKYHRIESQLKMLQQNEVSLRQEIQKERSKNRNLQDNVQKYLREVQNLGSKLSRSRQQNEGLNESIREYQEKIIHIQNTQVRIIQEQSHITIMKLQDREALVATLQNKIKSLEQQLSYHHNRDQETISNLHGYENKINLLSIQIERLNTIIESKQKELMQSRSGQYYEEKIKDMSLELQKLNHQIFKRVKDNQEKDLIIQGMKNGQNNVEIINLKRAMEQLENINLHTIEERDELFRVSHELQKELNEYRAGKHANSQHNQLLEQKQKKWYAEFNEYQAKWKNTLNEQENKWKNILNQKENHYKLQISRYLSISSQLQEQIVVYKQREQLLLNQKNKNQEEKHLKYKIADLQNELKLIMDERNELRIQNTNLAIEINELMKINQELSFKWQDQGRYTELQRSKHQNRHTELLQMMRIKEQQTLNWQQKYNSIFLAYEQLYNNYHLTKNQHELTFLNIKTYEQKLFKLEEDYQLILISFKEKEKENYELKIRIKSFDDLYQKNILLSAEIDRLTVVNRNFTLEINQLRLKFSDDGSLQKRLQEHLGLAVVLFAEIESLRARVISSEQQCEDVRRSSIMPLRVDKKIAQKKP